MNWWWLYPLIGLAIGFALVSVDAIDLDNRLLLLVVVWVWPIALPFLIWHGISVLKWKRTRSRPGDRPTHP